MNSKAKFPNLIIGGSPKCGSSSLFFWLARHPEVCASSVKETGFLLDEVQRYNAACNFINQGAEGFGSFFEHFAGEKICMEATPEYLHQQRVPFEYLRSANPKPKVLFIFREPSERIYSAYRFHKYTTRVIPKDTSFEQYLTTEFGKRMIRISKYADFLPKWIESVGNENVRVLEFNAIKKDPAAEMIAISEWLGISDAFWNDFNFDAKNQTMNISNHGFHRIALAIRKLMPPGLSEGILKKLYYQFNSGKVPEKASDDAPMLEEVKSWFTTSNQELSELVGTDIDSWK